MNFIILADKHQKGMKSKGCLGLLQINRKNNIIDFQYKNIKNIFAQCNIVYIYGFDSKKVSMFFKQKQYKDLIPIYNSEYDRYNYVHSLSLALRYMNDDCIVTFGDTIFKSQIFAGFDSELGSQIFINNKIKNKLGCTIGNDSNICQISFDLDNYLSSLYYISQKDIDEFKSLALNSKYKNYFVFEIINKMIDRNIEFKPFIKNNKNTMHNIKETKLKI